MVDEDSFLLDDFSRLINYWIFLPLFVVLRGKSFFIRSSSILFYWIVGFLCFCGEKCAWLSKLSSSIPFFPKSFFMGSMRILFYEMVDIFCLWVEQNVFSYQSSLSSFFFIVEISFYTVDEDSLLLDDISYSRGGKCI